ncbi:tRNA 2-thiouridine(34) synthase MnmA [Pacificimonas flava]|uniref:tRNA-specific 2-thiouridylase MnmA n=2 Tax=Pacificimonas TaxID=1960290 RepID=A0A219B0H8_9SPHN|nr:MULTISPECIES: tRNA 2-thiouridine(34) synthase MnmA [Pacificimonas]MBZ6379722.1 tRNA 2-thiouridine(34) synthase MnmA [Pacificimonas aurantium]OWV31820.1 tRNA 2-thiouridine(34) synthase MnmA [Pacificimonas flava]
MSQIDLNLPGPAASRRVVVAMSGGVDSSVVAALVSEAGYETVGITLQLYDHGAAVQTPGTCCAGSDIRDARRVADGLGIPHYVLDYESSFRESVIDDFADSYARGETPIPCVRCNQTVKFRDLLSVAKDLGADALATGHYVRRVHSEDGPRLLRGTDPARDQSYFLFATTREQLDFLRFPLGAMDKAAVRDHAARFNLGVATKPDSQDICFVPSGDYAGLVKKLRPETEAPGNIVDLNGNVLGQHRGLVHYTVGQRRGIDIGGQKEPLYVVRLDPDTKTLVVGPREALGVASCRLSDVNWLGPAGPDPARPLTAKIRSMAKPAPARFDGTSVIFAAPEYGVSPGQAAVLYDGDRVMGGGWIADTQPALAAAA